jgi:hypothetical protein
MTIIGLSAAVLVVVIALVVSKKRRESDGPPAARAEKQPLPTPVATHDRAAALLAEAVEMARTGFPGGELVEFVGEGIDETGAPHPQFGKLEIEFGRHIPGSTPPIDPSLPVGAPRPKPTPARDECDGMVYQNDRWQGRFGTSEPFNGITQMCMGRAMVQMRPIDMPRCTMRAIWTRAIADGAPRGAIAKIVYDGSWKFEVDDPRAPFKTSYSDDCVNAERVP